MSSFHFCFCPLLVNGTLLVILCVAEQRGEGVGKHLGLSSFLFPGHLLYTYDGVGGGTVLPSKPCSLLVYSFGWLDCCLTMSHCAPQCPEGYWVCNHPRWKPWSPPKVQLVAYLRRPRE
ncbi:UNVERIFIED_CONTAM: hypothetical protein K2H54_074614 [Gekko kuhli]